MKKIAVPLLLLLFVSSPAFAQETKKSDLNIEIRRPGILSPSLPTDNKSGKQTETTQTPQIPKTLSKDKVISNFKIIEEQWRKEFDKKVAEMQQMPKFTLPELPPLQGFSGNLKTPTLPSQQGRTDATPTTEPRREQKVGKIIIDEPPSVPDEPKAKETLQPDAGTGFLNGIRDIIRDGFAKAANTPITIDFVVFIATVLFGLLGIVFFMSDEKPKRIKAD